MGACGGTRCLARASQILAEEAGLSVPEQLVELKDAMTGRFIGKRPVLEGANLATEELNQAMHFLTGNLAPYFAAAQSQVRAARSEGLPATADAPITRKKVGPAALVVVPPSNPASGGAMKVSLTSSSSATSASAKEPRAVDGPAPIALPPSAENGAPNGVGEAGPAALDDVTLPTRDTR
jgi:hypothetical protein